MKNTILLAAGFAAGFAGALGAQSDNLVAHVAISGTPVGALPPILTSTLINRLQNGASLALRYGSRNGSGGVTHAAGVTGILPMGLGSTVSLTGGLITCGGGCQAALMLGVGGDMRIYERMWGTTSTSPLFTVSLDGELGYGRTNPGTAISGYVGAPLTLVQRGTGMQFAPFVTPAFAFAQRSVSGSSTSGSMMMVGGGLGIYNMLTNVSMNVGVQHAFTQGSRDTFGLAVTIGGK
jgi:hypothetical protein